MNNKVDIFIYENLEDELDKKDAKKEIKKKKHKQIKRLVKK